MRTQRRQKLLDFSFTEEQEFFRTDLRRFRRDKIVPRLNELEENRGFYIVHEGHESARGVVAPVCAGAASRSLENAMTYMNEREALGRAIAR